MFLEFKFEKLLNIWQANDSHITHRKVAALQYAARQESGTAHLMKKSYDSFVIKFQEKFVHIYRKNEQKYLILSVPAP